MSSAVKISVYIVAVVTILTVAMTVFVKTQVTPEKVKKTLLPLIENSLNRSVDFGEVKIGLFSGISVADITVMQINEEKVFFSIKSAELHYQFWKLFLGKVVVDQILLDRPVMNCVRDSDGQFNFIDLLPTAPSDQYSDAKSTDNKAVVMLSDSFNLLIKEVNISDGQVLFVDKYKNQRTPFRYTFSKLNVKARQIAFDKSIPIDLSAVVNGSNIDVSGNYNLSQQSGDLTVHLASLDLLQFTPYYRAVLPGKLGSALLDLNLEVDLQQHLLSSKGTVSFEDVDLKLDNFPNAPLKKAKIGTEYALNYRIDKKLLSLSTLLLNFNGIKLGAEGEIDLSRPDPFLVFTLLLKQFDLREVMQSLPTELFRDYRKYSFAGMVDGRVELSGKMSGGVELLKSVTLSLSDVRASAENLRAGISGDVSFQEQTLRSENLVLQYGDQQAMLQLKAKKSSDNVFRGDFSLSADTLNLNKILPEQMDEIQVASEDNGGISELQIQNTLSDDIGPFNLPIDMVGTMVINRLIYKQLNIDRVTANLSLKNNYLVVDNLTSQIGDGQLKGATIVNFGVRGLAYQGELGLSQSNVTPLLTSFLPQFNQGVSGALQLHSRFSGHGTIPVNLLRNLQLKGSLGLQDGEISSFSLLGALASFLGTSDFKVLSFQSLNGQYDLQDGLTQINGYLDSSKVKLTPTGTIDSTGRLNLKLDASFAPEILNKLGINKKLKETISGRDGWGTLPLEIQGTLDNPLFSYDASALQNQILEKASQKLIKTQTPDDVGSQEPIRKMLDNTLDKLFRK